MKRLPEVDVQNKSVSFAADYIEKKFKKGRDSEKSLVLNTTAHGFYMGTRHVESSIGAHKLKFWVQRSWTQEEMVNEGIKAAQSYIRAKGYKKLDFGTLALIRACISSGFRSGMQWRANT